MFVAIFLGGIFVCIAVALCFLPVTVLFLAKKRALSIPSKQVAAAFAMQFVSWLAACVLAHVAGLLNPAGYVLTLAITSSIANAAYLWSCLPGSGSNRPKAETFKKLVQLNKQAIEITPENYLVVGRFKNGTNSDMSLHLEIVPEEVILAPGDEVELLARPTEGLLPLTIEPVEGGLQIHANYDWDPDWHVRFLGKLIKAQTPTHLSDHR